MKKILLIAGIAIISCCSAKKTADGGTNNKTPDSLSVTASKDNSYESDTSLPACIKKLIRQFQQEEIQSPPRSVYSYIYNGKIVFFVPVICCDFFSDLYDNKCNLIAHPDGGFTGRGDGRAADFIQTRTNEKLIWKDARK